MMAVKFAQENSRWRFGGQGGRVAVPNWLLVSVIVLACGCSALAQTPQPQQDPQSPDQQAPGIIYGTVVDQSGAAVAGARVKLTRPNSTASEVTDTSETGVFSLDNIPPGSYQLTVEAAQFATQTISATLEPGQMYLTPTITMAVAPVVSTIKVTPPTYEVAEVQLQEEEQQRIFGFIPNFYVTYVPHAVPLSPRQKFRLALKTMVDPVNVGLVSAAAGIEQASNQFGGYGQGPEGYGKRFGASYADFVTSTLIGSAALPVLLKQDPRYFYKGTGTKKSRVLYAIANAVICKGDNGRWQPNYSSIASTLATGGISNLYYPPHDRTGAGMTFENAGISFAEGAATNLIQEFVVKKLTPNLPNRK